MLKLQGCVLLAVLFFSALASAQCTLNGEQVRCDQIPNLGLIIAGLSAFWLIFAIGVIVFVLVFGAFWVWMLVDCVKNDFKDRTMWLIIIVLTGILGAGLYFFMIRKKRK